MNLPTQDGLSIHFDTTEVDFISAMGLDQAEAVMMEHGNLIDPPVQHLFIPGYYVRTITMPKDALITSKIHRTKHKYQILSGDVSVWIEGTGTVRLMAPYEGITFPGTRRLLFCHEQTVWQTFHYRDDHETTVEQIENRIIEPHFNSILGMTHREMSKITNHEHCILSPE